MSEFKEVMKQAQRMCDYRRKSGLKCNNCDAVHICGLEIRHVGLDTLCADADAVMSWAAEHPMPEYPSWIDFLSTVGLIIQTNDCTTCAFDFTKAYTQIPADIAQKLGIEPKGDV